MSTRAVFRFREGTETYYIYKHHDGYLEGAAAALFDTIESGLAWSLPRFEPDEFAAAFIAANKKAPGGIRLLRHVGDISSDVEFVYDLAPAPNGQLILTAWTTDGFLARSFNPVGKGKKPLFYGRLKDFLAEQLHFSTAERIGEYV